MATEADLPATFMGHLAVDDIVSGDRVTVRYLSKRSRDITDTSGEITHIKVDQHKERIWFDPDDADGLRYVELRGSKSELVYEHAKYDYRYLNEDGVGVHVDIDRQGDRVEDRIVCAYASDESGQIGASGEAMMANNKLCCTDDAEIIVRPKSGLMQSDHGTKVPMCQRHGEFCAGPAEANWEILHRSFDGLNDQMMSVIKGNAGNYVNE